MTRQNELTAVEAARQYGYGLDYVYKLLWTGKLPARKVGKRWLIPAEAIESRLKAREVRDSQ